MGSPQFNSYDKSRHSSEKPCLLLVEDDDFDIIFMQRSIKKSDYDISLVVARDGAEALDLLRAGSVKHPYIIVTDINMPGMSGHEMIEEIRAEEKLKKSVIFILSSSELSEDIDRAYENNVVGYISKQQSSENVEDSVDMLLKYCSHVNLPQ